MDPTILRRNREVARRIVFLAFATFVLNDAWSQPLLVERDKPSLAPMLKQVTPAVVNISVVSQVPVAPNPLLEDPFFRRFFDIPDELPRSVPEQSAGSGVIVDAKKGYVLTNQHVVRNAEEILVTLADNRRLSARLIGADEATDIAMLEIVADGLTEIEIGNSSALEVGDYVVAIGNPFGLGQTVTAGIVSALGRSGLGIEGYEDFIQTDASINPGSSGGALVDLDGKLVGINTAIVSASGGNVGIGFAVPVDMARQVAAQLLEYGEVRRGRLGILVQDLTPDLALALELDVDHGAIVTQIEPNSSAERAGIKAGDVVVELDGVPIAGSADLRNRVGLARAGTDLQIAFVRDGRRHVVGATVETAPAEAGVATGRPGSVGEAIDELRGAELGRLDSTHPQYGKISGVLVVHVEPGSPADLNGLRDGDIITAVNRREVSSVEGLARAVREAGSPFALNIARGGGRLFLLVQ